MSKQNLNALPDETAPWIESLTGEKVVGMSRHMARREAWVIDTINDGEPGQYFLRIERGSAGPDENPWSLERETRIIQALENTAVPAQKIIGWNPSHKLALQQMVPGEGELNRVGREQQARVYSDFAAALAELHKLDVDSLGLQDYCRWPETPEAQALGEVENIELLWRRVPVPNTAGRLFSAFGRRWLVRHLPQTITHTVLVQGDTGPANFMFDGDKVSAFVDWEWAHIGDPMEDLGNVVVRDFFYPSSGGQLGPVFAEYESLSGIPVDLDKVRYYSVQQMLRSVMSLMYTVANIRWNEQVAMNMGYEVTCQRVMCDAIARAMGVAESSASLPQAASDTADSRIYSLLGDQLEQEMLPAQDDPYLQSRVKDQSALLKYLHRRVQYGAALEQVELDAINTLLSSSHKALPAAEDALLAFIEVVDSDEAEVGILNYLGARARRQELLMEPLVANYAGRRLPAID